MILVSSEKQEELARLVHESLRRARGLPRYSGTVPANAYKATGVVQMLIR